MKKPPALLLSLLFLIVAGPATAQEKKTLAERLGYPKDAKLLIVHDDDIGVSHSVNSAAIKALESGAINSGSIMVPCPWFPEIADYAKTHPDADLGLHLTMTSERVYVRWGPVASKNTVPSLVDANGYLQFDWPEGVKIDPRDAEREMRAQVERALAMGVRPTHLDSHQYRLLENGKDIFEAALRVAHDYKLPLLIPAEWAEDHPYLKSSTGRDDILMDHIVSITPSVPAEKWNDFYIQALKNLQPGVTEFIIHLAYDNDEFHAMTRERDTWGAAWRQRDFDFFTSAEFRKLLQQQNIKLVTWREIGKLQKP
jgi:chitin disaccharide deacetylase